MEPQPTCVVGAGLVPALPVGMADFRASTRGAPTSEKLNMIQYGVAEPLGAGGKGSPRIGEKNLLTRLRWFEFGNPLWNELSNFLERYGQARVGVSNPAVDCCHGLGVDFNFLDNGYFQL